MPANPATRDDWTLYAGHRARLTEAILAAAPATPGRLCVLGAGRCNDLDLERAARAYAEIHLVDIDPEALDAAVGRQSSDVRGRLHRHAPIDLSGMSAALAGWRKQPPTFATVEAQTRAAVAGIAARLPGPFDVVVSACVLTQMSFRLKDVLGEKHLMLGPIGPALMVTHLGTLLELTAPAGTALFVCDLVSSNAYPLAALSAGADLRAVMNDIVDRGAFYFAANPPLVRRLLRRDPALSGRASEPELVTPWLWSGAFNRTYFVYALRLRRLAAGRV